MLSKKKGKDVIKNEKNGGRKAGLRSDWSKIKLASLYSASSKATQMLTAAQSQWSFIQLRY